MADNAAFIDTNVLVYANQSLSSRHQEALSLLRRVDAAGSRLWISRQILREYLATVTRPQGSILPMSAAAASAHVEDFEKRFRIAEDGPEVTARLLALLQTTACGGAQIHDANIVATMQTYSIPYLLTFNGEDFRRFGSAIRIET